MSFKSYIKESRLNWGTSRPGDITIDEIKTGCLLRIADSLEKLEEPYKGLLDNNEYLGRRVKEQNAVIDQLKRSNAALRGAITRMKGKKK